MDNQETWSTGQFWQNNMMHNTDTTKKKKKKKKKNPNLWENPDVREW
jgi:hypothetical protein